MLFNVFLGSLGRLVNGLVKTAQGVSLGASSTLTPAQDEALKLAAMKCLVGVLRSMSDWMNKQLRLSDSQYQQKASQTKETNENGNILVNESKESADEPLMIETDSSSDTSEATSIKQHPAHKLDLKVKSVLSSSLKMNVVMVGNLL